MNENELELYTFDSDDMRMLGVAAHDGLYNPEIIDIMIQDMSEHTGLKQSKCAAIMFAAFSHQINDDRKELQVFLEDWCKEQLEGEE